MINPLGSHWTFADQKVSKTESRWFAGAPHLQIRRPASPPIVGSMDLMNVSKS